MSEPIKLITRDNVKHVHAVIKKHMLAAAAELGMRIEPSNGSWTSAGFSTKVKMTCVSDEAQAIVAERNTGAFEMMCLTNGIDPTCLNRTVAWMGGSQMLKIVGFLPRKQKCVSLQGVADNKMYNCRPDQLRQCLKIVDALAAQKAA